MKIYNTFSRKVEEFKPIKKGKVGMYTCGPTVYYYPQIGNYRTFVFYDLVRRSLEYVGFKVNQVMNATDVGHLTGDNLGDADLGEDRMEKAAKREGKTAWEIADFYIEDFKKSWELLNIEPPTHFVRATDHIQEQIDLIQKLFDRGLAYTTHQGVYFNVSKFPEYGKLGGQKLVDKRVVTRDELVEDPEKKHPFDFALWKFSPKNGKRQMEWKSPWGVGFPGWHIECSAMSMKYLGETFDIHAGGIDHVAIHHTNEIAQSEGATGKPFANYWMHGEFLKVEDGRMGKSLGNAYLLKDVMDKGFEPLALRYFYFTAHYRRVLNFTWEGLESAQNSLSKLRSKIGALQQSLQDQVLQTQYKQRFLEAVNDDLNMPKALAVVWKAAEAGDLASVLDFDKVLGLGLNQAEQVELVPQEVVMLADERERYRLEGKFQEADKVRERIEKMGYTVSDTPEGSRIGKK